MKKLVKKVREFVESTSGVSPVVATLVLIVVAVAGAVAVGTITGSFASDTASQATTADVREGSKMTLLIGGSTTVQPLSEVLAEAFMREKPGIKVEVQGGGSGAGMTGVGEGILDIGASSEWSKVESALKTYPDLKYWEIGGSAVVVIANLPSDLKNGTTGWECKNITKAALVKIYNSEMFNITGCNEKGVITADDVNTSSTGWTAYQRNDPSGTEETFAKWLTDGAKKNLDDKSGVKGAVGNAGVLEAVKNTPKSIGFVDFGFAKSASGIVIMGIDGNNDGNVNATSNYTDVAGSVSDIETLIKNALKAQAKLGGGEGLTRHLYYVTKGEPDPIERAFIEFALSPNAVQYFAKVGYFSIYDYKSS